MMGGLRRRSSGDSHRRDATGMIATGPASEGVAVMLGVKLLVVAILGQMPDSGVGLEEMVGRLGANRYSDREAASKVLEGLGRPALPVLRAARDSRDPEIRTRASGLVHRIEDALLTQATRVRLDFQRAPLTDVVRSIGRQAGFQVVLYPDNLRNWKAQRVTLRQSGTVPFWKAVDLLCESAGLQAFPELNGVDGPREPTFALTDATARPASPSFDQGPFRVYLQGIRYESDVRFGATGMPMRVAPIPNRPDVPPPGPGPIRKPTPVRNRLTPVTNEQFTARFLVAAEPRLFIGQAGSLRITEAVDSRGHSLVPSEEPGAGRRFGFFSAMNGPVVQLQAHLRYPADPGESIRRLRGVVPLTISSRAPDPLIVPLDARSLGRRFTNPDVEITLLAIRTTSNAVPQTQIDLAIRPSSRPGAVEPGEAGPFGDVYRPDLHRQQLEIADSRGRLVSWFPSGVDSENARITLTLPTASSASSLKELRYYTLTRTTLNLAFAFTDIPMP